MDMCDLRRELKKTKFEPGSTYKQINNTIKKEMRIAKEIWINNKCRGRKGNLADAGNLADSNISETINDTKKNSINNL